MADRFAYLTQAAYFTYHHPLSTPVQTYTAIALVHSQVLSSSLESVHSSFCVNNAIQRYVTLH